MSDIVQLKKNGRTYDLNLGLTSTIVVTLRQTITELRDEKYLEDRIGLEQAAFGLLDQLEEELSIPEPVEPVILKVNNPDRKFKIGDRLRDQAKGYGVRFFNVEGFNEDGGYYGLGGQKYDGNTYWRDSLSPERSDQIERDYSMRKEDV